VDTARSRKSFGNASVFLVFLGIPTSGDHESLSRPPMRLSGHLRGRHSAMHEDENVDSQSAESGDSDNVGSDDSGLGVQLSGSLSESDEDAW
jgi:hypothetical protein